MARIKPKNVLYRRKRAQRTDYNKRLKLLLSRIPRLVVRMTNTKIIAQLVDFFPQGDKVLVTVDSSELKKKGWNHSYKNMPAIYLAGLLLAQKAGEKGVKKAILDTGMVSPLRKGRIYAFLKGAVDGGLDVPHDAEVFPAEDRLNGSHIKKEKITDTFNEVKKKIMG